MKPMERVVKDLLIALAGFKEEDFDQPAIPPVTVAPACAETPSLTRNGPIEQGVYAWNGKKAHCQPIPWRILDYMEGKNHAQQDDVIEYAWGKEDFPSDPSFRRALSRANSCLSNASAPFFYVLRQGCIVREA